MNKIYLISLLLSLLGFSLIPESEVEDCLPEYIEKKQIEIEEKIIIDNRLVEALIQVESGGKEDCVGDIHLIIPSIGVLQIRPIMVREVNRILKIQGKDKRYNNKDRYSRIKSIEIFNVWRDFHHKDHNNETIARCWNGGPKGWKRKATLHYWKKVQKALKTSA